MNRRMFMQLGAGVLASGSVFANVKTPRFRKSGELLNLAVAGAGGKGWSDWQAILATGRVRIVAMCDVDANALNAAKNWCKKNGKDADFPVFSDWRKMLETVKNIDALTVSTPDHMHGAIAITAMKQGINVYVQKPLVRTIWEAEYFRKTAIENGVVTQMGNQGSSMNGLRRSVEILRSGVLGDLTEVHVWTNRPEIHPGGGWRQSVMRPKNADPVPSNLDWDLWLGISKERPYAANRLYHPFGWRGWFDFGTGAFGDMACHTMNMPFRGLELGDVEWAEALETPAPYPETYPSWSKVQIHYAARANKPAVDLFWYDGYRKPVREIMPQVIDTFGKIPNTGCIIIGKDAILLSTNDYGEQAYVALKGDKKLKSVEKHEATKGVAQTLPRINGEHYKEFVDACFGETKTFSGVDHSVPFVEGVLVGCLAQRLQGRLAWNPQTRTTDNEQANEWLKPYVRPGWEF